MVNTTIKKVDTDLQEAGLFFPFTRKLTLISSENSLIFT
ncbi:hypothetical protein ACINWC743_A0812 [Acinetobacter sp. WC-743]|nr:hypothetical protein ACINWC743_A0812 [Acinetobacter sp. WC-743]